MCTVTFSFLKKMIDKPVFYDRVKDALLWSSMDY